MGNNSPGIEWQGFLEERNARILEETANRFLSNQELILRSGKICKWMPSHSAMEVGIPWQSTIKKELSHSGTIMPSMIKFFQVETYSSIYKAHALGDRRKFFVLRSPGKIRLQYYDEVNRFLCLAGFTTISVFSLGFVEIS